MEETVKLNWNIYRQIARIFVFKNLENRIYRKNYPEPILSVSNNLGIYYDNSHGHVP